MNKYGPQVGIWTAGDGRTVRELAEQVKRDGFVPVLDRNCVRIHLPPRK